MAPWRLSRVKIRTPNSTHKKVMIRTMEGEALRGFLNPAHLGQADPLELLTPDGEHLSLALKTVKNVCFVNEFTEEFEPIRKAFFSRPKLDGLWVRLRFRVIHLTSSRRWPVRINTCMYSRAG